jgi:pimeloyl-ACP methyl ester carboxylesterase
VRGIRLVEDARELEPVSRTYISQGLQLHYLAWGDPGAPLLLLVHGICEHARSWDQTARALCDDWHVVAPDLRGHGDSAWSPDKSYLTSCYLLDMANLMQSLPHQRATVIAHSLGGNVIARFTAVFPEQVAKLILIEGLGPSPDAFANWERQGPVQRTRAWIDTQRAAAGKSPRIFDSIAEAQTRLMKSNPRLSAELAAHLARYAVRPCANGFVWKHDPLVTAFSPEDFALEGALFWKEIAIPTLLFQGTESWTTNPEIDGRAVHFRDRRTVLVEGAGHWVQHDQFESFIASLREFLSGDGA